MKQIKLFYGGSPGLEEEVNSFCKDVYVTDIKIVEGLNDKSAITIMVIYEPYINADIMDKQMNKKLLKK